ncbi:MAG: Ni/Fe hydrogenase subunit alpha [Anaerolineae bacterium]
MTTLIFPLSRIEGHAQIVMRLTNGEVTRATLQATEMRGFEYFLNGAPAEQLPTIVARICGVCSTAHHVASVKALENIFKVEPPPAAVYIRELLMLGQLIQNQATSLFLFTMPDFPGHKGVASAFEFGGEDTEIAARALEVRRAGTELINLAGGQFIHPIRAVVGGVSSPMPVEGIKALQERLIAVLPVACDVFERYWQLFARLHDRIGTFGDDSPSYYLAAIDEGHAYYGRSLRVLDPQGIEQAAFSPCDYQRYLAEVPVENSYSNATLFNGHIMRANSLARLNLLPRFGTVLADNYLLRFQREWGHPAHAILLFDLARGIELVYCIEKALEMLEHVPDSELKVPYEPLDGEGCGVVEAPRGPLIHHYRIENGLAKMVKFIIPTQHNILAIEQALMVAARRYVHDDGINLELERAIGRVVRAFDPCISCATH